MSRAVEVALEGVALAEVDAALAQLGIAGEAAPSAYERLQLDLGLECRGDPVDRRVRADALATVHDVGVRVDAGRLRFICSDVDAAHVQTVLAPRWVELLIRARLQQLQGAAVAPLEQAERAVLRFSDDDT
jgi:hypothetical protein